MSKSVSTRSGRWLFITVRASAPLLAVSTDQPPSFWIKEVVSKRSIAESSTTSTVRPADSFGVAVIFHLLSAIGDHRHSELVQLGLHPGQVLLKAHAGRLRSRKITALAHLLEFQGGCGDVIP